MNKVKRNWLIAVFIILAFVLLFMQNYQENFASPPNKISLSKKGKPMNSSKRQNTIKKKHGILKNIEKKPNKEVNLPEQAKFKPTTPPGIFLTTNPDVLRTLNPSITPSNSGSYTTTPSAKSYTTTPSAKSYTTTPSAKSYTTTPSTKTTSKGKSGK